MGMSMGMGTSAPFLPKPSSAVKPCSNPNTLLRQSGDLHTGFELLPLPSRSVSKCGSCTKACKWATSSSPFPDKSKVCNA